MFLIQRVSKGLIQAREGKWDAQTMHLLSLRALDTSEYCSESFSSGDHSFLKQEN